ncbi:FTR1 family iron permease [Falsibacillus albus]|uniref:FTR1 family iron permease n=1 Tax=Falsibacillus albus TaxID=2478915 RepID=A0A3L7JXC9_9BACI|nr:FTR1 family protein [Falsibacillus albus]RLQ95548.1 FTR1 family iron permease [Falsibacillus albus]
MKDKILIILCTLLLSASVLFLPGGAAAADKGNGFSTYSQILMTDAGKKDNEKLQEDFRMLKDSWNKQKLEVKNESKYAYTMLQSGIASISLALIDGNHKKIKRAVRQFNILVKAYDSGDLNEPGQNIKKIDLESYLSLIKKTQTALEHHDYVSISYVQQLQENWLSVEGNVVSQSKKAYNDSEKRLLIIRSYVEKKDYKKASDVLDQMSRDLAPLAEHTYGIWDAAMIPIREGLEALLVIGALLAITGRSKSKKDTHWVLGGAAAGLLASGIIGIIVGYVLSSSAFGKNNFLLNGISGVLASLMLLYVTYWLHRNSNIQKWNAYIKGKTKDALNGGRKMAFFFISFLAILREGAETVIFLIGMIQKMSVQDLLTGIGIGLAILLVVGTAIIKCGVNIPIKPFFLVSSIIVFYLSIKFLGTGIHSLQLSGYIPVNTVDYLIGIDWLGIYPSWYSSIPQLIMIVFILVMIMIKKGGQKK